MAVGRYWRGKSAGHQHASWPAPARTAHTGGNASRAGMGGCDGRPACTSHIAGRLQRHTFLSAISRTFRPWPGCAACQWRAATRHLSLALSVAAARPHFRGPGCRDGACGSAKRCAGKTRFRPPAAPGGDCSDGARLTVRNKKPVRGFDVGHEENEMTDIDREERIRIRAHEIWERQGRPEGRNDEHWEQARREIEMEDEDTFGLQETLDEAIGGG